MTKSFKDIADCLEKAYVKKEDCYEDKNVKLKDVKR